MILGRAAIYFDEVSRRGSIRRASEHLNIAPSAVYRQILQLEQHVGAPLFERTAKGLRLTAAGEVLLGSIRQSRRDWDRARGQIDDLIGLRRGEVSIALVEGAAELVKRCLVAFHSRFPSVVYRVETASAGAVINRVLSGDVDIGLTFNPQESHDLRIDQTLLYGLGLAVAPDHPLARRSSISLVECARYALVIPDDTISLRQVLDRAWARTVGGRTRPLIACNSIELMKSYARSGVAAAILTALDVDADLRSGSLVFVDLNDEPTPYSALCLVSASGRTLSVPASLLLQSLSQAMTTEASARG